MPLTGTLDVSAALAVAPTIAGLEPEPWTLPGASLVQVSYEVAAGPALAVTPPALHPGVPPYATFTVANFPASPHGPFNLAMVRLICRAGIRPRGLLVGAWTDNPAVADGLASGWGLATQPAVVALRRRHDHVRGTVTIGDDANGSAGPALDISLTTPEPIPGGDLELFDNLHLVNLTDADPLLVQVDPTYQYHTADRGQPDLTTFDAGTLRISGIEPLYKVIAVTCRADVELHPPRFVMDPALPAVQGTRRIDKTNQTNPTDQTNRSTPQPTK